jgi:hypothetical protein
MRRIIILLLFVLLQVNHVLAFELFWNHESITGSKVYTVQTVQKAVHHHNHVAHFATYTETDTEPVCNEEPPVLEYYMDGDTDELTAYQDYLEDLAWFYQNNPQCL